MVWLKEATGEGQVEVAEQEVREVEGVVCS